MSLLVRDNTTIRLQDHWPTQDDLASVATSHRTRGVRVRRFLAVTRRLSK